MCTRGRVAFFLAWNFIFALLISSIQGSIPVLEQQNAEEKEASTICTVSSLTLSEPEETYEYYMERFKLRPFHWSVVINYATVAHPGILAKLIAVNFVEAHFYGFNRILRRSHASDSLAPEKQFDRKILYKIMQDRDTMTFLGPKNCFRIINEIYIQFKPYGGHEVEVLTQLYESVGVQIDDFLEFILQELAPRYPFKFGRPDFDMEACAEFEYPVYIMAEEVITVSAIALFRNVDSLRIFVFRYRDIWPLSATDRIVKDALNVFKCRPKYFRQILSLLVRSTPEHFLIPANMRQYKPVMSQRINFCELMYNMAPIFRALMAVDSEAVQDKYLADYYKRIRLYYEPCLQFDSETLRAMNYFIIDSKFSIAKSQDIFNHKQIILTKILKKFFGFSPESYFTLARMCIINNCLALYEALLQYLSSEGFSNAHVRELLDLIISKKSLMGPLTAISITLGYFDFKNFTSMFKSLEKPGHTIECYENYEEILQCPYRRLLWIKELSEFIDSCPILEVQNIVVEEDFVPVPWPCPNFVLYNTCENDEEEYLKLFFFAQAILAKRFLIPIYNLSYFESYMQESATWSETISFINFMIELMAIRTGFEGEKLFRFIDTTEYLK